MPKKPTGIGALSYIIAAKLIYSELPIFLVVFVQHAEGNDSIRL